MTDAIPSRAAEYRLVIRLERDGVYAEMPISIDLFSDMDASALQSVLVTVVEDLEAMVLDRLGHSEDTP